MRKIKIFHGLVNYGTQAGLFSKELRTFGYESLSVVGQDEFKRSVDIQLNSNLTFIEKPFFLLYNFFRKIYWFCKFDIFHFYYGTTLFRQRDLPFYKLFGKKVVMEYLGWDVQLYKYSINKYEFTNARFYTSVQKALIGDENKLKRLRYEEKYIDRQFVCAPCYSEFVKDCEVLPLGIDIIKYKYTKKQTPSDQIVIMHAPTSRDNKGTSYIIQGIEKLVEEGYDIKFSLVENLSHEELKVQYINCDIFVDQILAGWYGTAAIEAMALGRPTVCFIRESYFEYINYGDKIPIINANPSNFYPVLKDLIDNKHLLPDIGLRSRQFVEEIHDVKKVTEILISKYMSLYD
jgi:glycosyltransferase involved in cell wall biosynthesis